MIVDVVLILVIAAYALLTGAALYGAGTSVANAVRRRRVTLAVEDQTSDDLMAVADAVAEPTDNTCVCGDSVRSWLGHCPGPGEREYGWCMKQRPDPPSSLREQRIVVPEVTA